MNYSAILLFASLGANSWAQKEQLPQWALEPSKYCGPYQLCALGEGNGQQTAAARARQELAKIFGTKVQAKFEVFTTSKNEKIEETVEENLREVTQKILKGVQISKYHMGEKSVYALASSIVNRPPSDFGMPSTKKIKNCKPIFKTQNLLST